MDEKSEHASASELRVLTTAEQNHQWDPNLAQDKLDELVTATKDGDPETARKARADFIEDSPYASVRAAVKSTDGEEPANTLRAWMLGMIFVTVASGPEYVPFHAQSNNQLPAYCCASVSCY